MAQRTSDSQPKKGNNGLFLGLRLRTDHYRWGWFDYNNHSALVGEEKRNEIEPGLSLGYKHRFFEVSFNQDFVFWQNRPSNYKRELIASLMLLAIPYPRIPVFLGIGFSSTAFHNPTDWHYAQGFTKPQFQIGYFWMPSSVRFINAKIYFYTEYFKKQPFGAVDGSLNYSGSLGFGTQFNLLPFKLLKK